MDRETTERFDVIDQRFGAVDRRFDGVDRRFDAMDQRFDAMDRKVDEKFEESKRYFGVLAERLESMARAWGLPSVSSSNALGDAGVKCDRPQAEAPVAHLA